MKILAGIFLSVLPLALLAGDENSPLAELAGEWRFEARSVDGKSIPNKEFDSCRMVISRDGSFQIYQGDHSVLKGKFLQPSKGSPGQAIDRDIAGRSEFSGKFEPIYRQKGLMKWDKDKLVQIFTRESDGPRPKLLDDLESKGLIREILTRKRME